MTDMVSPGTYKIPKENRIRRAFVVHTAWSAFLFFVISLAFMIYAFVMESPDAAKMIWHVGVTAVVCVIAAIFYYRNAHFSYQCGPVTVIFLDEEYYVPQDKMMPVIQEVLDAWRPHLPESPENVYEGVRLFVQRNRPYHGGVHISPDRIIGLTYSDRRASYIWGPYVLHSGGVGYELRLHGAEYLWPLTTEGYQIHRMKELEVI